MKAGLTPWAEGVYLWLTVALIFSSHLTLTINSSIPLLLFTVMVLGARQPLWELYQLLRPGVFFIGAALLGGIIFSELPAKSAKGVYDTLRGAVVVFPVAYLFAVREEECWRRLKVGLWVATLIFFSFFLFGLTKGPVVLQREFFHQMFGNIHTFTTGLGLIFVVALTIGFFDKHACRFHRWLYLLLAFFSGLVSWYLGSRGSVLAMGIVLLGAGLLRCRALRWVVGSVGVASIVAVAWVILSGQLDGWSPDISASDTSSGRLAIYQASLSAWWSESRLLGFGINTFKFLDYGQVLAERMAMPHSIYIELLVSLGLCGSLLFMIGVGLIARAVFATILSPDKSVYLGLGLVAYVLGRGLVDLKLWSFSFAAMLMAGVGMLLGKMAFRGDGIELFGTKVCSGWKKGPGQHE